MATEQTEQAWLSERTEIAFRMLFRSYYTPLCRYAHAILHDREEAEEVVQSAFITVWEKREQLQIEASPKAYLYRTVRNTCLNHIKHGKVRQQHALYVQRGGEPVSDEVSQAVESVELEARIAKAVQNLPEQCRLIFQMSRFEELKYQEIADQLNLSVKTVENQMGKALKMLREELHDYLPFWFLLIILPNW